VMPAEGMEVDAARASGVGPEVIDLEEKRRLECLADMEKIEKEFQDLKEKFYQEKVEALRKEIDTIQAGSHDKLLQKLRELEYKRDEKLWAARQWREYQLQAIETAFNAEKKQAEDEYESDKQTLKERMIQALNERQRKLEEEKNTLSLTDGATDIRNAVPSSRNLRSQKKGKENFTAVVNQRRKLAPSHISYTLKESEIQEDLAAIQKSAAFRDRQKANEIGCDRGALRYYDKLFEKGMLLTVEAVDGREPTVSGVLVGVTPTEMQIRNPDGTKARYALTVLRAGKYTVRLV